jgi:hypothetical protein
MRFDNSYARLPDRFYTRTSPVAVTGPQMLKFNQALADDLGIDLARQTRWSQAISRAAAVDNTALVALLAGLGMLMVQLCAALAEHTHQGPALSLSALPSVHKKPLRGVVNLQRVQVSVVPEGRNSFTPHIEARIEPHGDGGARLVGTAGPHVFVIGFLGLFVMNALGLSVMFALALLFGDPANRPPLPVYFIPIPLLVMPAILLRLGGAVGEAALQRAMTDVLAYAEHLRADAAQRSGVTFDHQAQHTQQDQHNTQAQQRRA